MDMDVKLRQALKSDDGIKNLGLFCEASSILQDHGRYDSEVSQAFKKLSQGLYVFLYSNDYKEKALNTMELALNDLTVYFKDLDGVGRSLCLAVSYFFCKNTDDQKLKTKFESCFDEQSKNAGFFTDLDDVETDIEKRSLEERTQRDIATLKSMVSEFSFSPPSETLGEKMLRIAVEPIVGFCRRLRESR